MKHLSIKSLKKWNCLGLLLNLSVNWRHLKVTVIRVKHNSPKSLSSATENLKIKPKALPVNGINTMI